MVFLKNILLVCLSVSTVSSAWASGGFQVPALGGIFQGPSVVGPLGTYWNPAAIGPLKGSHFWGSVSPTFVRGGYERSGVDPNTGGMYMPVGWSGFGPLPTAAFTSDFKTDRFVFGLGFYIPFGADIDYGAENMRGAQRYHLQKAQVASFFTTPTVAVKILPNLFVGAGVSWVYTRLTTSLSYDLASALSNAGFSPEAAGIGKEDPLLEAYVDTGTLSDHSFAWDLGAFWQPLENLDIGVSYRSEVNVDLTGSASIQFPPFPPSIADLVAITSIVPSSTQTTEIAQHLRWPQSLQAGVTYRFLPKWAFLGTVQWTVWSRLQGIAVDVLTPPLSQSTLNFSRAKGLRDSVYIGGTLTREFENGFKVGGRLAYDSAAVPTDFLNAQNLDFHAIELGIGGTYRFMKRYEAGLHYIHQFFLPRTNEASVFDPSDPTRQGYNYANSNGRYTGSLDKIEITFSADF